MDPEARYLSVKDAAAYVGSSPCTIRRRISDGTLPASRFGPKQIKIDRRDLDNVFRRIPSAKIV